MVAKSFGSAIATKVKLVAKRIPHKKPESFFYYAKDDYPMEVLEDCRAMSGLFFCFLPLCLYWGLYSQMNSRWIFQAAQMSGRISNSFSMMPEQMSIINCILVILLVKPFDLLLFPLIAKIRGRPLTYMNKITIAMFLGVLAFIVTAILQWVIESKGTFAYNPANPNVPICVDGCLNIFWQIPQYVVLTISEVFLSVANINLAYAMAPKRLKSFGGAVSLLTNAVGNLLVMLTTKWDPIKLITKKDVPVAAYLFWAVLCLVGMVWFMLVSKKYEHYDREIVEVQDAEVAEMKAVTTVAEDDGIGAAAGASTSKDALLINDDD
jgi:dipeptide/tripeptide permease